ncbi:glycosyltransferase family 87 protein [Streptomyces sp. SP18CS02]|uniref:glycosyltransferase family 87 protein n=1 Tax=Streptomyces sp. SP18CS02 TaxID=3002531 RepID=UPI002E78C5F2|nr:glycosyltransferase family 87 protein [Streptomyces sp. SP18CS02]MEE1752200.1 glycosyltransferase family 87 protein [Streptomyces sp. SP18CS02]
MTTHRLSTPRIRIPWSLERPSPLPLLAVWTLSRAGMLALLWDDTLGVGKIGREVYLLYQHWYGQLSQGAFPLADVTWQYPPGAGLVILAPGLLEPLTYYQGFVALTLCTDAAVSVALARAGGSGAWVWVGGLPLLLHMPLVRYDVQTTAFAVFALLAVQAGRPRLGGVLAGLGAMVKVWPALTLLGTAPGRPTRRAWASALLAAVALMTVLALAFSDPLEFLRHQGGRGVQIESLGGSALSVAHLAGWPGAVQYRYGSFEFTGPHVPVVARLSLLLTVAAFCWLLLWRVRARRWTTATGPDAALAAVLLFTVTSRVISPQYMIWLLGLAAVCLTCRITSQRPVTLLLLPAAALSALAYPVLYEHVLAVTPLGCAVMVARNALLIAATAVSCRRLWRATAPGLPAVEDH